VPRIVRFRDAAPPDRVVLAPDPDRPAAAPPEPPPHAAVPEGRGPRRHHDDATPAPPAPNDDIRMTR